MAGVITIKFSVMKGGIKQLDMKSPIYIPGPVSLAQNYPDMVQTITFNR